MDLQAPIIKGDKVDAKTDYRDALPVNFTAVSREILGAKGYLLSHAGLTQHATGLGVDRGANWNEKLRIHYRVSGQRLISLSAAGVVSDLGAVSGTDQASMNAYSSTTQAIVADGKMWLHDGSTLNQITDPELGTPIDITWIDGYYFLTDGAFLYHTDITDETSIDPLKFASSEFSPDPILAVDTTSDNQVIAFNRFSCEFFTNRATDDFAFQRIASKSVKAGCVGTHCETELESQFYILGGGKEESVSVHAISAGVYQSIATREIDKVIAQYTEDQLSTAVLETRVEDRDKFIVVRLPNETLLYNATIAREMGLEAAWTIVKAGTADVKWRGANGVQDPRIPSWVYGDNQDSRIGLLDNAVSTQYGEIAEGYLFSPLLDLETMSIDQIELDTIPGHQISVDDTTVAISLTYDGVTYGQEWWALYGEKNNYGTRFVRRAMGYVRENVGFQFRTASPNRLAFSKLVIDYS